MSRRRSSPALFELLREENALTRAKASEIAENGSSAAEQAKDATEAEPAESTSRRPTPPPAIASAQTSKERASLTAPTAQPARDQSKREPAQSAPKASTEAAPAAAMTRPVPARRAQPAADGPSVEVEAATPGTTLAEGGPGRMLRVPMFTVWIGLSVVVAGCFLLFTAGHQMGQAKKDSEWKSILGPGAEDGRVEIPNPASREPALRIADSEPAIVMDRTPQPRTDDRGTQAGSVGAGTTTPAAAPQAGGTGPFDEQRQAGLNYLTLGAMRDRAEAERLARWLGDQGMPAMVEVGGSSGNNRSYRIFTLRGITGSAHARRLPARTEHEARVAELGAIWLSDMGGTLNFTRPAELYWKKQGP